MSNKIRHSGIIDFIENGHIRVRILQTSACSHCSVANYCNASDKKVKYIDVYNDSGSSRRIGDTVEVVTNTSVGGRAVFLAFGVPFILLLLTIFVVYHFTGNEPIAALSALFSLIPYYYIVYLNRNRISRKISFELE